MLWVICILADYMVSGLRRVPPQGPPVPFEGTTGYLDQLAPSWFLNSIICALPRRVYLGLKHLDPVNPCRPLCNLATTQ